MRRTIEIGARAVTLIIRQRDSSVLAYGKDVANRGGGLDNVTHGSLLRVARFWRERKNQRGTEFVPFHKQTGTENSPLAARQKQDYLTLPGGGDKISDPPMTAYRQKRFAREATNQ